MESIDGEDDEVFVGVVLGFIVGAAAEGIGFVLISWLVAQFIIILL